jgi:hypothetical protein
MASTVLSSCAKLAGQAKFVIALGKPKNRAITDTSLELSFIQKYLPTAIERQTTGNAYAVMAGVMYVSSPKPPQVPIFMHDLRWLRPRHPFLAPAARMKPAIQPRWRQGLLGRHSVRVQHRTALPLKRTELLPRPRPARAADRCVALTFLQGSARVCCRRCSTASSSNPVAEPATSRASRCLPRRRAARHRSSHSGRSAR